LRTTYQSLLPQCLTNHKPAGQPTLIPGPGQTPYPTLLLAPSLLRLLASSLTLHMAFFSGPFAPAHNSDHRVPHPARRGPRSALRPSRYSSPSSLPLLAFHLDPSVPHGTPLTLRAHLSITAISRPLLSGRPTCSGLDTDVWTSDSARLIRRLAALLTPGHVPSTQAGSRCPRLDSDGLDSLTSP
jgi:hypothetical protein